MKVYALRPFKRDGKWSKAGDVLEFKKADADPLLKKGFIARTFEAETKADKDNTKV